MLVVLMKPFIQSRLKIVLAEHNLERVRRGEKPLTINGLAAATGLATSTITGLTTGRHTQVSFDTMAALCDFFERPLGDFFVYTPGDDEPEPEPAKKPRRGRKRQAEQTVRAGQ